MRYLLDASALVPLVVGRGKRLMAEASRTDLVTTDLAIHEACNALWKLARLLDRISIEDALEVAVTIKDLAARGITEAFDFRRLDIPRTLKMAHEERITFYDASYIVAAESMEATLVTEDEKLRRAASRFVRAVTYAELEKGLSESDSVLDTEST